MRISLNKLSTLVRRLEAGEIDAATALEVTRDVRVKSPIDDEMARRAADFVRKDFAVESKP